MFFSYCFFFFTDAATTEIYTLSLHDALPILARCGGLRTGATLGGGGGGSGEAGLDGTRRRLRHRQILRSEEHTSELQSLRHLVCRLLLEKKKKKKTKVNNNTNQNSEIQTYHE